MIQFFYKTTKTQLLIFIFFLALSCKNEQKTDIDPQTSSNISETDRVNGKASNTEKKGITAIIDEKTINTPDYISHATLIASTEATLVNISGVSDNSNQFQIQVIAKKGEELKQTHKVVPNDMTSSSVNYIEYKNPEDPTSVLIWKSIKGEVSVSENTKNRFKGSFNVVVKNNKIGEKIIKGTFNVKKNPFGS